MLNSEETVELSELISSMFPAAEGPGGPDPTDGSAPIPPDVLLLVEKIAKFLMLKKEEDLPKLVDDLTEEPTRGTTPALLLGVYQLTAEHYRFQSKWDGLSYSVRIRLPNEPDERGMSVQDSDGSWYGDIQRQDHTAASHTVLSRTELISAWKREFPGRSPPEIEHVELITGVRRPIHRGQAGGMLGRFSPLSVFLAYDKQKQPLFYALESGNFWGQTGRLHVAEDMAKSISHENGFAPTWFSQKKHFYHGRLDMQGSHPHESEVWVSVDELAARHFRAHVRFEQRTKADTPRLDTLFKFEGFLNQLRAIGRQSVIAQAGHHIYDERREALQRDLMRTIARFARTSPLLKWKSVPPNHPGIKSEVQHSLSASTSDPQAE